MKTHLHIIKNIKIYLSISIILVTLSIIIFFTKGLNYGIDFSGGNLFQLKYTSTSVTLNQINEKIANLNKMAEVLINLKSEDISSRKLARYDFSKLNLTESASLEYVNEEIRKLQEELGHYLDEYEDLVRRLKTFVRILNMDGEVNQKLQTDITIE